MSLRSPLGRVLGLGSARSGVGHWWKLRISSVALVPLTLWFILCLCMLGSLDHAAVVSFLHTPLHAFLMLVLILTLAHHSYLGVSVVLEDYVHAPVAKITSLMAVRFVHLLAGGAAVFAVLLIAFGNQPS